jgi:hypothetical protein
LFLVYAHRGDSLANVLPPSREKDEIDFAIETAALDRRGAELGLGRRNAKLDKPGPAAAGTPASAPAELNLGGQREEQSGDDFTDLFLRELKVGREGEPSTEFSFKDIKEAGGLDEIIGGERLRTPGVREVNDVLSALLGRTTGTQRARPEPEEMSPWQKGLLFVSDVVAAFDGRQMPSTQLDLQRWKGYSLQDQLNQESYLKGLDFINKFTVQLGNLPIESRMRFAIQQSARVRKEFGEGFSAILIAQAAEPTKQEGMEMFLNNIEIYKDGASDGLTKYMTYLTGAGDIEEAQRIAREHLFGIKGNKGALEMDALYHAPALFEGKLEGPC